MCIKSQFFVILDDYESHFGPGTNNWAKTQRLIKEKFQVKILATTFSQFSSKVNNGFLINSHKISFFTILDNYESPFGPGIKKLGHKLNVNWV
jgi:hypothetical protein